MRSHLVEISSSEKTMIENHTSKFKEVYNVLFLSLPIATSIFLFEPYCIYTSNPNWFSSSFISILSYFLLPALILIAVLCTIDIFLKGNFHKLYIATLLAIALLVWLQGRVFEWGCGLSNGGPINWSKDVWRGLVEGTLWILILISSIIFFKQINRIALLAGIIFLSFQLVYVGFLIVQKPGICKSENRLSLYHAPPEEIFKFSSTKNVIHILLDEFQSDIFQEIINEEAERYYAALDGFDVFMEAVASFPSTQMSIPAILSGKVYENDTSIDKFLDDVLQGKTIPNVLYENGYDVDLVYPIGMFRKGRYSNYYQIPVPYKLTPKQYLRDDSVLMLELVLFRVLPRYLKKTASNNWRRLAQPFLKITDNENSKEYVRARYFAHKAFLQDLIDNVSATKKKPAYKFIHLQTTHYPAVVNENCVEAGGILSFTRENMKIQDKCALNQIIELLNQLKLKGIYDSSLIIISADHGYWKMSDCMNHVNLKNYDKQFDRNVISTKELFAEMVCSAVPLLAVKRPHSKGPPRVCLSQVAVTDIPATIGSILNLNIKFEGKSIYEFKSDEKRERKFYYYDRAPRHYSYLAEFSIKGSVFDKTSWNFVRHHLANPTSAYKIQRIKFGTSDISRFLRFGWDGNQRNAADGYNFNWAVGTASSIFLSIPKDKPVVLTANIKTYPFSKPQHVTIMVDGKEIGNWEVSNYSKLNKYNITIQPDMNRPDISVVEFIFSQSMKQDNVLRPRTVLFESISLSNVNNERQEH